ncbi:MAG: peptide chain release factor N(5)-glutamine methyltransferase [Elusimicrobiota bacterium]
MKTCANVREYLEAGTEFLRSRKVPEAAANAEFIMASILECGRAGVHADAGRALNAKQSHHFWFLLKERARRVPLAYVLGTQPFCGIEIKVSPAVLVPRPETESLVEFAAETARTRFSGENVHIAELGTGSGCIAVALAKALPEAMIVATEISPGALRIAEENILAHRVDRQVRLIREDLFKGGDRPSPWAHMLVSNPPYVPSAEIAKLAAEVKAEPVLALDGGKDGLEVIRVIVAQAPRLLRPGGWILLEFGDGQAQRVRAVLEKGGFEAVEVRNDLMGKERVAAARFGMVRFPHG